MSARPPDAKSGFAWGWLRRRGVDPGFKFVGVDAERSLRAEADAHRRDLAARNLLANAPLGLSEDFCDLMNGHQLC